VIAALIRWSVHNRLLVLLAPVRRAVRFKPGEALRYA